MDLHTKLANFKIEFIRWSFNNPTEFFRDMSIADAVKTMIRPWQPFEVWYVGNGDEHPFTPETTFADFDLVEDARRDKVLRPVFRMRLTPEHPRFAGHMGTEKHRRLASNVYWGAFSGTPDPVMVANRGLFYAWIDQRRRMPNYALKRLFGTIDYRQKFPRLTDHAETYTTNDGAYLMVVSPYALKEDDPQVVEFCKNQGFTVIPPIYAQDALSMVATVLKR